MYTRKELDELKTNITNKLNEFRKDEVTHAKKIIYLEGQLQKIEVIRKTI